MNSSSFTKAVTCLLLLRGATASQACNLPFEPTLASAQAKAAKRQCPVLLLFTGLDWSPRSITLDKRLLEHALIEGLIERTFVPMLVDFPQRVKLSAELQRTNLALAEKYEVTHFPTLIALTEDGQEIGRLKYHEETVPSLTAILEGWATRPKGSPQAPSK
ncbi:MAG: thioredoxin family protein [Verrucomicrobiota bacterium]